MNRLPKPQRPSKIAAIISGICILLLGYIPVCLGQQEAFGNSMTFVVPYLASIYDNKMTVYLCTGPRAATVTVTSFYDNTETAVVYRIAANSSVEIPPVSKDLMLFPTPPQRELVLRRSVRIHSDVPISAYAHYFEDFASGSTTLTPVRKWGYFYRILDFPYNRNPSLTLAAAYDNTVVEITPTQTTAVDKPAGVPYRITLNKNEVYQLRLEAKQGAAREITESTVRVIPNGNGISYPIGVYQGSTTMIVKSNPASSGSADFEGEQVQPVCRWGKRFLISPFSSPNTTDRNATEWGYFRIMPENTSTIVRKNGEVLTTLVNGSFYEYASKTADYIEADGPVTVMQCMFTQGEETYTVYRGGDADAMNIAPLGDTCTRADFRLPDKANIAYTFVSLTVPTAGFNSLTINGARDFYTTYPHPNLPGYTVVVQRWPPVASYCTVQCNVPFTGICYSGGLRPEGDESLDDNFESCSFEITPVYYPEGEAMVSKKHELGVMSTSLCTQDSFKLVLKTEILPASMEWMLKGYPGVLPNNDNVVINSPVPDSTVMKDGHRYHYFSLPQYYKLMLAGEYAIPVSITSPDISYCSQTQTYIASIYVRKQPVSDFSHVAAGCVPFDVKFTAGSSRDTSVLTAWNWDFGDATASTASVNHIYHTPGEKSVYLKVLARNGCSKDTLKTITLTEAEKPVAALELPALICIPRTGKFLNKSTYGGTAGALKWQWDFGDNSKSDVKEPVHLYTQKRSYIVELITTAPDGCADTTSEVLTGVYNMPVAGFSQSHSELCAGDTLNLKDQSVPAPGSTIVQWQWFFGDGSRSTVQHPWKKYTRAGNLQSLSHYVVSNEGCISDTVTGTVTVYDIPRVDAGPDKLVLQGGSVQLQGTVTAAGSAVIKWSPAALLNSDRIATPMVLKAQADQRFYIHVTSGVCTAHDSVFVKVLPDLLAPNAFTPNGDGVHDVWNIPGLNSYPAALVQVFNRYGQKVFESKGYSLPWNGTYNNKVLPSGSYYYIIQPGEGRAVQKGIVTILR